MKKPYLSYLLRLWQTDNAEHPVWVASLEDPHTRQTTFFRHPGELWAYLQKIMEGKTDSQRPSREEKNSFPK